MTTVLCTLNDASLPISQLSSVERLSASDLFIVERLAPTSLGRFPIYEEGHAQYTEEEEIAGDIVDSILLELGTTPSKGILYNELLGAVLGYIHSNGKIRYDQLSARVFQDISCAFGFNTMAFKDTWEYDKVSHSHKGQYNDTRVFARYTPDEIFAKEANMTKIATWNIQHCLNKGIEGITKILRSINADIYCLQEVDKNTSRSGSRDQLEELRATLGRTWKKNFAKAFDYQGGEFGLGILYREEPLHSYRHLITPIVDGDEQRILQILEFDQFFVANTQLASGGDISQRVQQAEFIITKLNALGSTKPIWLCGDLNNVVRSEVLDKLRTKLKIVSTTSGTTAVEFENRCIDYILMNSSHAESKNRRFNSQIVVKAENASDHYPVEVQMNDISKQWLGDFTVWQLSAGEYGPTEIGIYIPSVKFDPYIQPDVGEVRFMGWSTAPTTTSETAPLHISSYSGTQLVADDSTSGWWCYCNGQTITCESDTFQDACQFFAGNPRATEFTLPSLNNFIMPNPRTKTDAPLQFVKYENYLSTHVHTINQPSSTDVYSLKGDITINSKTYGQPSGVEDLPVVHSGGDRGKSETTYMSEITCTLDSTETDLKTAAGNTDEVGDDIETKPRSNKLLALAYLGVF